MSLQKVRKKMEHVQEFWDKLDPRDRDIILRHADFKVNTLCDWKALKAGEIIDLMRWFYP